MGNPFAALAEWVAEIVRVLGYPGIALLVALENIFPPIPSELILPLAGFEAGQGRLWLPGVIIAATIGSVAGALLLYALGAKLGEDRIRALVRRHGRLLRVGEDDLDRAEDWFDRRGGAVVCFARLVPVVRSVVSVPAGLRRMPLARFVPYTAIGSTAWNTVLILLGWWLGHRWTVVEEYGKWFELAVLALLTVLAARWIVRRRSGSTDRRQTTGTESG